MLASFRRGNLSPTVKETPQKLNQIRVCLLKYLLELKRLFYVYHLHILFMKLIETQLSAFKSTLIKFLAIHFQGMVE